MCRLEICCAAPLQQRGTADRYTTWASGFCKAATRVRNTHVLQAVYEGRESMTCCSASEATVHRNTWRQGRRWSDREELGVGVERECLDFDHKLQLDSVKDCV